MVSKIRLKSICHTLAISKGVHAMNNKNQTRIFVNVLLIVAVCGVLLLSFSKSALARSSWWHPQGTVWGDSYKPQNSQLIKSQTGVYGTPRLVLVATKLWGGCSGDMQGCTYGFRVKDDDADSVQGTATRIVNVNGGLYGIQVAQHKAYGLNRWTTGYTSYTNNSTYGNSSCFIQGPGHPGCN